jgi:ubiquitin-like 1-activating enzyme E1 B
MLPDPLPRPPRKIKAPLPIPETPLCLSLKRGAPDDEGGNEIIDLEPTPKRPPLDSRRQESEQEPQVE